mmetsp:Transcript_5436/g.7986  ORF Transcript_5436/g.7986 Transcript_5436/m.7986 type:complete len:317 (-) Transcript_5436:145-1095(-)
MRARKLEPFTKVDVDVETPSATKTTRATSSRRQQTPALHRHGKRITVCIIFMYGLIRLYYAIELRIKNPYLKALLYSPLRTFHIRYLDMPPSERKTFRATTNNTFVIHLESDVARRKSFEQNNKLWNYQFYPATQWVEETKEDTTNYTDAYQLQQKYAQTYPFVGTKSQMGQFGDAASTISHIRLMEQLLQSQHEDYYIIFEDDIVVKEPLLSSRQLQAAGDAHVVFLVNYATKLTTIQKDIRVLQGYGAQGYVVTKVGATLILKYLSRTNGPFDCVMAGDATGLRVYLPQDWPLVRHVSQKKDSSRRAFNAKKTS